MQGAVTRTMITKIYRELNIIPRGEFNLILPVYECSLRSRDTKHPFECNAKFCRCYKFNGPEHRRAFSSLHGPNVWNSLPPLQSFLIQNHIYHFLKLIILRRIFWRIAF